MILSDAIDFSRLLGSPMKKTSFGEQNRLAALQTKGLVVVKTLKKDKEHPFSTQKYRHSVPSLPKEDQEKDRKNPKRLKTGSANKFHIYVHQISLLDRSSAAASLRSSY